MNERHEHCMWQICFFSSNCWCDEHYVCLAVATNGDHTMAVIYYHIYYQSLLISNYLLSIHNVRWYVCIRRVCDEQVAHSITCGTRWKPRAIFSPSKTFLFSLSESQTTRDSINICQLSLYGEGCQLLWVGGGERQKTSRRVNVIFLMKARSSHSVSRNENKLTGKYYNT